MLSVAIQISVNATGSGELISISSFLNLNLFDSIDAQQKFVYRSTWVHASYSADFLRLV